MRWLFCLWLGTTLVWASGSFAEQAPIKPVVVGSKNFNENYILAEVIAQLLEANNIPVQRKFGLGGTLICYEALRKGEIDLYVEYTGTLSQAILKLPQQANLGQLNKAIAGQGLEMMAPFGFNNTYALVVREAQAKEKNLQSIGDLAAIANLKLVFSHEFLERQDGWPGLSRTYQLGQRSVQGIEHGLAYQAINEGAIDVTDAYSTDGELQRYGLVMLKDDKAYFPSYFAAPLVRRDLDVAVSNVLAQLVNTIDDERMQNMNAQVVFAGHSFAQVAQEFLLEIDALPEGVGQKIKQSHWSDNLYTNTLRHLQLTGLALVFAVVVGLSLALAIYKHKRISELVIYFCGLLQTIPSIALLALMIPLFGIGIVPAVVALFLYSLLPILRNATTALAHVDPSYVRVAQSLGLTEQERLRHILIPLSVPAIFAGVRTAAVISIGTATLAAFIGAGGLGDPIVVGLSLNDVNLILSGAIPAAILAIVTELIFGQLERVVSRRTVFEG